MASLASLAVHIRPTDTKAARAFQAHTATKCKISRPGAPGAGLSSSSMTTATYRTTISPPRMSTEDMLVCFTPSKLWPPNTARSRSFTHSVNGAGKTRRTGHLESRMPGALTAIFDLHGLQLQASFTCKHQLSGDESLPARRHGHVGSGKCEWERQPAWRFDVL